MEWSCVDYLWITVMFYQLFGFLFWRHPFTAEDPSVSKWCNAKFSKIWTNSSTCCMLEDEYIFSKFGRTIPLNETSGYNTSFSVALRSQYWERRRAERKETCTQTPLRYVWSNRGEHRPLLTAAPSAFNTLIQLHKLITYAIQSDSAQIKPGPWIKVDCDGIFGFMSGKVVQKVHSNGPGTKSSTH